MSIIAPELKTTLSTDELREGKIYTEKGYVESGFSTDLETARNLINAIDANRDGFVTYSAEELVNDPGKYNQKASTGFQSVVGDDGRVTYANTSDIGQQLQPLDADGKPKTQKSELKKFCENVLAGKDYLDAAVFEALARKAGFSSLGMNYFDKNVTAETDKLVREKVAVIVDEMFEKAGAGDTIEGSKITGFLPQGMNGGVVDTYTVDRNNNDAIVKTHTYTRQEVADVLFQYNREMFTGDGKVTREELFQGLSKFMLSIDERITDGRTTDYNEMMAQITASQYDTGPDLRTDGQKEKDAQEVIDELNETNKSVTPKSSSPHRDPIPDEFIAVINDDGRVTYEKPDDN